MLSTIKFDFENKPHVTLEQINRLLPKCYERFENRRKKINYNSDKVILIKIIEDKILVISFFKLEEGIETVRWPALFAFLILVK